MKLAKLLAALGVLAMSAVLFYGFAAGDFFTDGARLMANPWGVVSLVDLYVGFTLFSMWIVWREKSRLAALIWVVLMMTLGFFAGALYVLIHLQRSGGDVRAFLLGRHV